MAMFAAFVQLQVVLPSVMPDHAGAQNLQVLHNSDHHEFRVYHKWQPAVPVSAGAGNQQTLEQIDHNPELEVYHTRPDQTPDQRHCNETKMCIVQFDDRPRITWQDSLAILATYNENRCHAMSCCQYVFKSSIASAVSPYWAKVLATKEVLEENRQTCDYVFWIDDDAALHPNTTVNDLVQLFGDKSFVLAPDPPCLEVTLKFAPELCRPMVFNAGVWGVRQSTWGNEIMSTWAKQYPTNNSWVQNATSQQWDCVRADNQSCVWAGDQYEQGAFVSKIMANGTLANEIRSISAELIMERNCSKSPLIYHMFNGFHSEISNPASSTCPHYFYYSPSPPPLATPPDLGSGFDDQSAGTNEELDELQPPLRSLRGRGYSLTLKGLDELGPAPIRSQTF